MSALMYQLRFGLDPNNWRLYQLRDLDQRFKALKARILERDKHTCLYCGFQAFKYFCVLNYDQNYKNNQGKNLVTACPFCAQCHFLPMIGSGSFKGGTMIYLPEISQEELNGLCHVIFCAIANATEQSALAQTIYNNIRLRSQEVEQHFGKGLSDPKMCAQMLIDTPLQNRTQVTQFIFKSLRLLPSRNEFSEQIMTWSRLALDDFSKS